MATRSRHDPRPRPTEAGQSRRREHVLGEQWPGTLRNRRSTRQARRQGDAAARRVAVELAELARIDRLAVRELDDVAVGVAQHAEVTDDRAGVDGTLQKNALCRAARGDLVDGLARGEIVAEMLGQ